jgi:outer membrane receptor protein involved in Fe transport
MIRHTVPRLLAATLLTPLAARAQGAQGSVEQVTVVGTSPLPGQGISADLVPQTTQVLTPAQISRTGTADVLNALSTETAGVNLDSASGNQYQPTLFYDGFEVSPLQGTPQGVAVYVNGVRFNQPFGDTVNWDLIPDIAVRTITVEGSNPVFGLNALGGAFAVALKDGFSYQGTEIDLSGGSFDTLNADAQFGRQYGDQAIYLAANVTHQGGWRDGQSTDIQNFLGDWGKRTGNYEVHATLALANSDINGPGTSPVQLIAADPAAMFTAPNLIANRNLQFSLRGNYTLSDALSVQAQTYYSYFQQHVVNGNSANDFPCDDGTGLLCQSPGVYSTTRGGVPIPALFGGNPLSYSELDENTTNTNAYGGSLQLTDSGSVLGHANHLTAGASFDGAETEFSAIALIGGIGELSRAFTDPGITIDEPGNNVPVRVAITNSYGGAYATDTLNLTDRLALTVAGRFNFAEVDLDDQGGGDLTGRHAFARFNPSAGITYKLAPYMTFYGGYAEANRAPTPSELSCAGPGNSCSLANFFTGDPDLKQVVAQTEQAGLRGHFHVPFGTLRYDASLFHSVLSNDIEFINSPVLNRAYFANIGQTRRQGAALRLDANFGAIDAFIDYTYVEATYLSGYVESAGSNPAADANGNITIRPGDTLPGIPRSVLKFGAEWQARPTVKIGLDGQLQSGQFLFGDEANLTPRVPGFFVLNAHANWQATSHINLFLNAQNLLNRQYYTYGTFSPTNGVFIAQAPNATNPRAYSVAAPIGITAGVKVTF